MRKLVILAAFAAVASATTLHAQGDPPRGARGRGGPAPMLFNALLKDITLSDAQKAQLDKLREAEREKMQAEGGRGRGGADFEAIREARQKGDTVTVNRLLAEQRQKMDAQRDAQISAIRAVLVSSDQLKQFDANVADLKKAQAEGRGRGGRRGGPPPRR
jgi:Spy/CpxP family protein refolding chaperone